MAMGGAQRPRAALHYHRGMLYYTMGALDIWQRPYYYTISTRIWNQDERRGARGDPHGLVVPGGHTGALGASRRPGGSNMCV